MHRKHVFCVTKLFCAIILIFYIHLLGQVLNGEFHAWVAFGRRLGGVSGVSGAWNQGANSMFCLNQDLSFNLFKVKQFETFTALSSHRKSNYFFKLYTAKSILTVTIYSYMHKFRYMYGWWFQTLLEILDSPVAPMAARSSAMPSAVLPLVYCLTVL